MPVQLRLSRFFHFHHLSLYKTCEIIYNKPLLNRKYIILRLDMEVKVGNSYNKNINIRQHEMVISTIPHDVAFLGFIHFLGQVVFY